MSRRLSLVIVLPSLLLGAGCSTPGPLLPGNEETDRIAQVVADAISWPRQDSAMGYARAAAGTSAAVDGRLTVIGVEELDAEGAEDPFAELTLLVHLEGSSSGLIETDPVTACYEVELGSWGVDGSPSRTRCPDDPRAVDIPPAPEPGPIAEVAEGADLVLLRELRALAATPGAGALVGTLDAKLPVEKDALPAEVDVLVEDGDVAVAVRGEDACLLGSRVAGRALVWRPADVQLQPGELTCDAATALSGWGQEPPH